MERSIPSMPVDARQFAGAIVELSKPVTWFPPMWAFMCGVVSSGRMSLDALGLLIAGLVLAGPLLCAGSQAVNDWFDRDVDAINEPGRPIPSGRIPSRWGLWIAIGWSVAGLVWAALLGPWVFVGALAGVALSWAYSAPPIRLKRSGIFGPLSVGFSYEGIAWFTGAAVMVQSLPDPKIITIATLFSLGAYGIMILNDFKAVEGDRRMGLNSLPARLGAERAAWVACIAMIVPQLAVIGLLMTWAPAWFAGLVFLSVLLQVALMFRLMRDPERLAPWFNATGILLYVLGMLASAFALSAM